MPKPKAPDNMPTEVIQKMFDTALASRDDWQRKQEMYYHSLQVSIEQQVTLSAQLSEYAGWLWLRENESKESN